MCVYVYACMCFCECVSVYVYACICSGGALSTASVYRLSTLIFCLIMQKKINNIDRSYTHINRADRQILNTHRHIDRPRDTFSFRLRIYIINNVIGSLCIIILHAPFHTFERVGFFSINMFMCVTVKRTVLRYRW